MNSGVLGFFCIHFFCFLSKHLLFSLAISCIHTTMSSRKRSRIKNTKNTRYLLFRCCAEPRHWKRPLTMMPILVQSASHSSIEWDVRTTDCPPLTYRYGSRRLTHQSINRLLLVLTMDRMQFQRNLLAPGSMPVVGSSRKTIEGLPTWKEKVRCFA